MRVLVACEFSGVVRDAFRARGHDAWSCDILPAEDGRIYHHHCNVLSVLTDHRWDLMIAHPPCTFLCNSGVKWLYKGGRRENGYDRKRVEDMQAAAEFYMRLRDAKIPRKAIENPIMHRYAMEIIRPGKRQFIQPWQFGHGEIKATGLELINLPRLVPTNIVEGREPRVHKMGPSTTRWAERSRTLQGIADAMAEQWGSL